MVSSHFTARNDFLETERDGGRVLTRCRRRSASARWASSCCLHCAAAALASRRAPASLWLLSCSAKNSASHWTSPTELQGRHQAGGVHSQRVATSGGPPGLGAGSGDRDNTKLGSRDRGMWSRELN